MADSQVPLKLRKQMLLMRAAVERVELAQQVLDVRRAATVSAIVRNAMPGHSTRGVASRAFDMVKRYPFLASAASLLARRFKFPLIAKATKWGGAATVVYKLWTLWQQNRAKVASDSARVPRDRRLGR